MIGNEHAHKQRIQRLKYAIPHKAGQGSIQQKQNIVEGSMASGTSKEMELKQTNYLLDQQIRKQEETFVQEGGLRERMTRARLAARGPWRKEQP